jgi:Cys-rich protein (TIGR01571 family)
MNRVTHHAQRWLCCVVANVSILLRGLGYTVLTFLVGLMATVQQTRTRKAYGIQGDIASDCVRATCCTCCTLIQDETEIKKREEERSRTARATGATFVSHYMAPTQMSYGPLQR